MQTHFLLSVSSDDKPGVVERLSSAIQSCGGNWLESRLANLRGKFVGMIWVSVPNAQGDELKATLAELSKEGISVQIDTSELRGVDNDHSLIAFSVIGPDRTGIVMEISLALSANGINLEELETNLSSAPYSGEAIIEAKGSLSVSDSTDTNSLIEQLTTIADNLGLDLDIEA
jgi:glycine cleavage system regulatory protein